MAGIGHNKSERQILTNTTTSGRLDITDSYLNYDFFNWNLIQSLPDIGFNLGYSYTPSHKEKVLYMGRKTSFNGSVSLVMNMKLLKTNKQNFIYLGYMPEQ